MPNGSLRSARPPLEGPQLEELALGYAARFATSAAKLHSYLRRKLRERGWSGEGEPPVAGIVARLIAAGYVDDAAYAKTKASGLLRRGYGARRVDQALNAAGIDATLRKEAGGGAPEQRAAAVRMARKRRFGPFGSQRLDRAMRERQIAAMLRAGHPLDSARRIVDADSEAALEQWVEAAEE
jgi:regulatory protein